MSFDEFLRDTRTQDAVLRCLEVIGEAANHVSAEMQELHVEIPWGRVIAFRNRLIHGYFEIDYAIVWSVIVQEVRAALLQLERLVSVPEVGGDAGN